MSGLRERRPTPVLARPDPGSKPAGRPYAVLVGALLVMVATVLAVAGATGLLAVVTPVEFDPGTLVRYGLPVSRAVHDAAAAVTIGLLVVAAWCVGPDRGTARGPAGGGRSAVALSDVQRWMVRAAAATGVAWLAAAVVVAVLTAADVTAIPVGTPGFGTVALSFLGQIELGRSLLVSLLVVAVTVVVAALATRVTVAAAAAVLAVLALLPLALGGHSAGSRDHANAVSSLAIHLVGVCVWVGGLVALLLVARRLGSQLPAVVGRYSTLALWCFVAVAASGIVNAWLRLGSVANLATSYGLLVLGKTFALGLLGVAGTLHRRFTLRRLAADGSGQPSWFVRLAAVEVLVMAATIGLAVVLSRSAPPSPITEFDPVAILLGYPAPPPLTPGRYLTVFYPDVLWLAVAGVLAGAYVVGVVRLRGRGDRWPVNRLVFWLLGCLALVWVTSGGPGVYGRVHFSSHMIQHMTLMTLVPLLLVFGAPITLALRTLSARTDGSFGPRELLMRLVHARYLKFLGHPVVAFVLLTVSLMVFYYSRLFSLAMFTHTGHVLMAVHFLAVGYLYVWSLVGIDPGPSRPPYPFRLMLLLVTLGFHAFFAISLMAANGVLAPDWWRALGQTDTAALLADQQQGGAIAWAAGDVPSLLIGVALLIGWIRSDAHEARRRDRQADRDGDAELKAYNEQLAELARRYDRS
ncbi:MAG: cytochrome c oxidase assembly protein [Propionibacteriaceae bacterium]